MVAHFDTIREAH
jgi:hypothetical protein